MLNLIRASNPIESIPGPVDLDDDRIPTNPRQAAWGFVLATGAIPSFTTQEMALTTMGMSSMRGRPPGFVAATSSLVISYWLPVMSAGHSCWLHIHTAHDYHTGQPTLSGRF